MRDGKIKRIALLAQQLSGGKFRAAVVMVSSGCLAMALSGCSLQSILDRLSPQPAQPAQPTPVVAPVKATGHHKMGEPQLQASQQDIFDYIRGKLLSLSPSDGLNDNLEVTFDPASSVLSVTQPDGHCDIFLDGIDTNSALWETVDPSEPYHTRPAVLRVTMNSRAGKRARVCYNTDGKIDLKMASNRARLLFSLSKAEAVPDFTEKMDKAFKKFVVLSGGAPEEKIAIDAAASPQSPASQPNPPAYTSFP
jgi:hypothetical protein